MPRGTQRGDETRQQILSLTKCGPHPPQVVQAEVVQVQFVRGHAEDRRSHAPHPFRRITNAYSACPTARCDGGLGEQTGRIGEIDEPGVGTDFAHRREVIQQHRDRAHGHREAARPGRLLPEDAVAQRDALIHHARGDSAYTKGGDDEISAGQRGARVGGAADPEPRRLPCLGRSRRLLLLSLRQLADDVEPIGIHVHQRQLGQAEALPPPQHRPHDQGGAHTPSAQDHDLQANPPFCAVLSAACASTDSISGVKRSKR